MKKIVILNGVNLGYLGTREVNLYGTVSFEEYLQKLKARFEDVELLAFQTDSLEQLVQMIHQNADADGIIINPGAYTHTSVVIADALRSVKAPAVEVHISNVYNRERFRRNSWVASACIGTIAGLGLEGYELAVRFFSDARLNFPNRVTSKKCFDN